ncbi:DNA-binding transcriptional regulator, AcrR family [Rhodococcus koreensis]|uniref:DNA-binding transcriptional regulator, AcrR family n=2 Tax=Nocardiaceae TaxID=85025 RepID=A0A1H5F5P3_9NOCA|nr:DNA-binding transcriptional regulator, AcrR family [Rhodococcus koreensis]
MKIFGSAVRQASSRRKQPITVASICKEAGVSSTTFYYHFERGINDVFSELLLRSVRHVEHRIREDVQRENPDANYRVVITIYRLVEELFRYPNMFELESVPREWVQRLAEPLAEAIGGGLDDRDASANHPALIIAEYHVNAIIGLIRRDFTPSFDFMTKLVISQVIPVIGLAEFEFSDRWHNLVHSMPRF